MGGFGSGRVACMRSLCRLEKNQKQRCGLILSARKKWVSGEGSLADIVHAGTPFVMYVSSTSKCIYILFILCNCINMMWLPCVFFFSFSPQLEKNTWWISLKFLGSKRMNENMPCHFILLRKGWWLRRTIPVNKYDTAWVVRAVLLYSFLEQRAGNMKEVTPAVAVLSSVRPSGHMFLLYLATATHFFSFPCVILIHPTVAVNNNTLTGTYDRCMIRV